MKDIYRIIRKPIVTEKSNIQKEEFNKVTFEVDTGTNKVEITNAVQRIFNVKVEKVNLMTFKGKKKRVGRILGKKSDWKKAVVTLKPGDKIEFFEGI